MATDTADERMTAQPVLMVVDDDPAVAKAIAASGAAMGLAAVVCDSAEQFRDRFPSVSPSCVVLDIKMPGESGLELLRQVQGDPRLPPVIMISGHGDIRTAVEAMRLGAITFLEKPFAFDELCRHINEAIARHAQQERIAQDRTLAGQLLGRLKPREKEMLDLLVAGRTNKQMATALELSVRGVEDRRARIMEKLEVGSIAELCSLVHLANGPAR
jgi:FixJ family two-component response regulator